jgi:Flp pilus assembly protein TadD
MTKRRVLNYKTWATLIFGVAFLVRLIYLLQVKSNPYFYSPDVDELWHLRWAIDILEKGFWGSEVYFRGPLYPYLLALLWKVTGASYFWTRLIQLAFGAASVSLTYLLGREYFSERTARLGSVFYAIYGTLILYEGMFLIEGTFIFLNLLGLLILARNRENPRKSVYLLCGVVFGLSAIARPNILLVVPLLGLWLLVHFSSRIGVRKVILLVVVFFAGVAAPIVPVTVRNYVVADDFVMISSQGGINLYLGNNPSAEGLTMIMPEIVLDARVPWTKFIPTVTQYAEKEMDRPLKPSEVSSFWSNRAKQFIYEHPGTFLALTYKKLVYFFSGFENSDQMDIYDFTKYSSLLSILIFDKGLKFPYGLFAPLALLGIGLTYRRWRPLTPLLLFVVGYVPSVILFLVTARHRLAVIPIFLLFGAYAVFWLWDALKESGLRKAGVPLAILVLLLVLSNINFFDLGFRNVPQIHFGLGLSYIRQGNYPAAIDEFNLALKEAPSSPPIYLGLGTAYIKMGRSQDAIAPLNQAITLDPNYTDAYINLGQAYFEAGDVDRAEMAFRRATTLEPNRVEPYLNLGEIFMNRNDLNLARQNLLKALDLQPDNHVIYAKLGVLYGRAHDTAAAAVHFSRALQINPHYAPAYLNWGNICLINGDTTLAMEKYYAAIQSDSTLLEPYFNLAVLFLRVGDTAMARDNVDILLRLKPDFAKGLELKRRLGD